MINLQDVMQVMGVEDFDEQFYYSFAIEIVANERYLEW